MLENREEELTTVRVQDPRVHNEGSWNSYVDYKIFLHTNSKAFTAKTSCVRRRYREFVWLRRQLQRNAGLVPVPELPGKGAFFVGSSDEFIEKRRRGLQLFLERVLQSVVLLSDSRLHLFLQSQLPVGAIEGCLQRRGSRGVTEAILAYAMAWGQPGTATAPWGHPGTDPAMAWGQPGTATAPWGQPGTARAWGQRGDSPGTVTASWEQPGDSPGTATASWGQPGDSPGTATSSWGQPGDSPGTGTAPWGQPGTDPALPGDTGDGCAGLGSARSCLESFPCWGSSGAAEARLESLAGHGMTPGESLEKPRDAQLDTE